jgi:hypothetical protein
MYGYGVILIIEKWDGEPIYNNNKENLIGFTYFELKGDTVYQNGEPIFDAGQKTHTKGYVRENYEYSVVLSDIDYSVNNTDQHIITAVGLGFKEDQADPDMTSNYMDDGSLKVGYTVTSVYSMMVAPNELNNCDYNVGINLLDGVELYGFPYNFDFHDEERTAEEKVGPFKFVQDQFLPRLTNDIFDKSVNWLITEMSQSWLTNRIGSKWSKEPFIEMMQIDTMLDNKPRFVSGMYQTFNSFKNKVEKIQTHYAYLTNEESFNKKIDDNMYTGYLKQTDGLSPFFVDKGFSHFRVNTMYMLEREPNTAIGWKVRFGRQHGHPTKDGPKTIIPTAFNGLEIRINSEFILKNKNFLNERFVNAAKENPDYSNYYRNTVCSSPMMAQIGSYREYFKINIEKKIEVNPVEDPEKFGTFYKMFKHELDTRNLLN